jgi:plastocyanin
LVDYRHDEFASSFLHYYPKNVIVHRGDTVDFKVTWSGEPHSVTMGTVVDRLIKYEPIFEKYDSRDAAIAGGVPMTTIHDIDETGNHVPGMTTQGENIYQPGARPCYIPSFDKIPAYSTGDDETPVTDASANCPKGDEVQPAFNGRQGLYNSGFIPFQGPRGNSFTVHIAKDAKLGTFNYFCNYHWTNMRGTVKIVPQSTKIPSQAAVSHAARLQINKDAAPGVKAVAKVEAGNFSGLKPPLAGVSVGKGNEFETGLQVNEFYPRTFHVKVNDPVTWTVKGSDHTVSFNVPKYFPVFTVAKSGDVRWDPKSFHGVGWTVPPEPEQQSDTAPTPRVIDVGKWDGGGGFHSSGLMAEDETFTLRFTKPGTYPYACVVHPPMIGTVVVTA